MMMQLLAQDVGPDSTYVLWGSLLFGVALVLLMVELFVPSGGLIGILAGVAVIGSIISFFKYDPVWGMASLVLYVVLTPFIVYFMFKFWLTSPIAKRMILGGTEGEGLEQNTEAASVASEMARSERINALRALIGTEGTAATDLRPIGKVMIDGQRIDGMAESGLISANTPVIVTDVYDNQIKVRPR